MARQAAVMILVFSRVSVACYACHLSNLENHADIHLSANQLIGAAIKCPENESALNCIKNKYPESKNKIMYMHNEDKDK